jgi:hypothetical protein
LTSARNLSSDAQTDDPSRFAAPTVEMRTTMRVADGKQPGSVGRAQSDAVDASQTPFRDRQLKERENVDEMLAAALSSRKTVELSDSSKAEGLAAELRSSAKPSEWWPGVESRAHALEQSAHSR